MNNQNTNLVLIQDLGMLYPKETSIKKYRYAIYKCFCGKEFKTMISSVKKGNTKSCGCNKINHTNKGNTKHNLRGHRLYSVWFNIINRCTNPKCKSYKDYGLRNITVCEEWKDINNFINDMYPSFMEGLSIDRIDNDLGYSKDNCRWANRNIQQRNKRIIQKK